MSNKYRTHKCNELSASQVGQTVTVSGWVNRQRNLGGMIFIDLRDRDGLLQINVDPQANPQAHKIAEQVRAEYVIRVSGKISQRPEGMTNPDMLTGEIELMAEDVEILNASKPMPFIFNDEADTDENIRLKYRYLDLRRPRMQQNMILRHKVVKFMRDFLDDRGFVEIETPILLKSTPEGARDYLVPSRLYPGKFYALPQSPQQLKQLLMVSGFDKYFQIARCFRDEDQRADRQPEFTQLDIEMSFVEEDDILELMETMFTEMMENIKPEIKITRPFPRLSYTDSMSRYGNDKPDLRFGLELADISDLVADSEFGVFKNAVADGGIVKGFAASGCANYSRKQQDKLVEFVRERGAKGLVTIALEEAAGQSVDDLTMQQVRSQVAKFFTVDQIKAIAKRLDANMGDLLLIGSDQEGIVNTALSALRVEMGNRLELADPNQMVFAFIQNYPLFEWNPDRNGWDSMHHPFTAPHKEDIPYLNSGELEKVKAKHYDFVCNGYELSSGSIRIHDSELQLKVFKLLGYPEDEIKELFAHLLEALDFGAPPHGGIAPGIDRFLMLLAGEENIREVIAFPKNKTAQDLMTTSPDVVSANQLRDLHLAILDIEEPQAP